jgi:hypothetical protein
MIDALKKMDAAYAELRAMFISKSVSELPDADVTAIIEEATRRGLWSEKNTATLERMAGGGPLGKAFLTLTAGNPAILRIIEEPRRDHSPSQLKGSDNASEPRIDFQPNVPASPKRGRPPKHRICADSG